MGEDESGTVARLLHHMGGRLGPAIERRGGRVIRLKGDGGLIEFASAVDALAAAIDFQQAVTEANRDQPEDSVILFRVGIHLGDVIVDGADIYGDDVNVAARLETEAPGGGIVVSRAVREAVNGRLKATLHALGDLALQEHRAADPGLPRGMESRGLAGAAAGTVAPGAAPAPRPGPPAYAGTAAAFHRGSALREHRRRSRARVFRRRRHREPDHRPVAHERHAGDRPQHGVHLQGEVGRREAGRPRVEHALCARRLACSGAAAACASTSS